MCREPITVAELRARLNRVLSAPHRQRRLALEHLSGDHTYYWWLLARMKPFVRAAMPLGRAFRFPDRDGSDPWSIVIVDGHRFRYVVFSCCSGGFMTDYKHIAARVLRGDLVDVTSPLASTASGSTSAQSDGR